MASRALAIVRRLDSALNRVQPSDRTVYKRVITTTGGDQLIGRPGTQTPADTILSPQPQYQRLARYMVGPGANSEMLSDGVGQTPADNYMFLCSPDSLGKNDLESDQTFLVLRDSSDNNEIFEIIDYEEVAMGGVDVLFIVYAKSIKRP